MAIKKSIKPKRKSAKKKPKSTKKKPKKSVGKYALRLFIYVSLAGIILLFTLFGTVYIGLFGPLPSADDLRSIKNNNASELVSSDGALLGKYFIQNRSSINYSDIPKVVIDALVATEDSRFFEHNGIDFYSIPRVVIKTIILGDRSSGGGSTISQQLIKNVFGRNDYGALSLPVNKLKENITALKLEDVYSKEEIITLYLNTVSFGENVFGIKAASRRFFNKLPKDLRVEEAATLIGMLKANTSYNPRLYPEASKSRRNTVLALMTQNGAIEPDALQSLLNTPLKLDYQKHSGQDGAAPYLQAIIEEQLNTILENTNKKNGEPYNLYTDGLRIELTINSRLQAKAKKAVQENMKALQKTFDAHWQSAKPWGKDQSFLWNQAKRSIRYKRLKAAGKSEAEIKKNFNTVTKLHLFTYDGLEVATMTPLDSVAYHQMILQAGFLAMNAHSGDILAYVGGIDFGFFPYDHVYSKRQVGSTFKPFVYAAALEAGIQPCDFIKNERIIFSNYDDWSPENANNKYGGYYSVKGGLTFSVNTIAARLIAETGPQAVRTLAHDAGIESDIPNVPAIALGVANLSLYEMVKAYSVFGNEGKGVTPRFIQKITTSSGEVIYDSKPRKAIRAIDENTATEIRAIMELVVDSGTARRIRSRYHLTMPLAGKTGTTQNNADGWFMAISPNVVCGAWVGAQSPIVRFRSTALGQGAATALPIVATWLKSVADDNQTKGVLGTRFPPLTAQQIQDLFCPLFIESKSGNFIDKLFDPDRRQRRQEMKDKADERKAKNGDEGEKDGWIQRLLDKLKKN